MTGRLTLVARDADGSEVDRRDVNNLITSGGRGLVADFFSGRVKATPRLYIAVGKSEAAAAVGDTALKDQLDRAEARADVHGNIATVSATLHAVGSGEPQPITEAGIVIEIGDSAPVLYNRVVFPVVNKSPTMELTLSWEVVF